MLFAEHQRIGLREPEPCGNVHLPRYDGMAVLRAIRAAPVLEHIQVLVLSGLVNPRQEAEITGLGAFYRRKPSSLSELSELAAEMRARMCGSSSRRSGGIKIVIG